MLSLAFVVSVLWSHRPWALPLILVGGFAYGRLLSKHPVGKYAATCFGVAHNLTLADELGGSGGGVAWPAVAAAVLFCLAYDIRDDVLDVQEDAAGGRRTIAVRHGPVVAARAMWAAWLGCLAAGVLALAGAGAAARAGAWVAYLLVLAWCWRRPAGDPRWPRLLCYPLLLLL